MAPPMDGCAPDLMRSLGHDEVVHFGDLVRR
jgi:hypothetical protein